VSELQRGAAAFVDLNPLLFLYSSIVLILTERMEVRLSAAYVRLWIRRLNGRSTCYAQGLGFSSFSITALNAGISSHRQSMHRSPLRHAFDAASPFAATAPLINRGANKNRRSAAGDKDHSERLCRCAGERTRRLRSDPSAAIPHSESRLRRRDQFLAGLGVDHYRKAGLDARLFSFAAISQVVWAS
jgi:hypothetical protein